MLTLCVFTLQEGGVSLEISTKDLKVDPRGVFVIYEWEWEDGSTSDTACRDSQWQNNSNSSQRSHASVSYPLLNMPISNHPTATHIKCIGAVMDEG